MHSLILRYDLIREKCTHSNEETQKFIGGFIMGKVFTWLFGAITGFITGVTLIAWSVVVRPKEFVKVAESFIEE